MKKTLQTLLSMFIFIYVNAQNEMPVISEPRVYSHGAELQAIMDKYTVSDLPGISVAVYSKEGWWKGASGFSRVETKTLMTTENLQYAQSVSKMYMAVAILRLNEEGRIDLDAPITKYLPAKYQKWIRNSGRINVRMLLNHTSGIAEYITDPLYTRSVLLTPLKVVDLDNFLECLADDEPQFHPGERYLYTNTNFTLLAMIADYITGDHRVYIQKEIFEKLGLKNSYYHNKHYLNNPALVDSYWDLLNVGRPANITPMQKANVQALVGDDGVICTPEDAVKFFIGLRQGKLLNARSMELMEQWVRNAEGREVYGLGLIRFDMNGLIGYGHGGGGIGAGCALIYVPGKEVYIFLATNTGVVWDGLAAVKANEMKDELTKAVFQ